MHTGSSLVRREEMTLPHSSCKTPNDKFWIRKGSPGKSLTIAMDKCGGKNKNNFVLRVAPYLVEMGYFLKVEFAFYIRGHTNNARDRTYNQMKSKYHKKDIYHMGAITANTQHQGGR
jgi:hypothetical protein